MTVKTTHASELNAAHEEREVEAGWECAASCATAEGRALFRRRVAPAPDAAAAGRGRGTTHRVPFRALWPARSGCPAAAAVPAAGGRGGVATPVSRDPPPEDSESGWECAVSCATSEGRAEFHRRISAAPVDESAACDWSDLGDVLALAAQRSLNDVDWGDLREVLERAKQESLRKERESLAESWDNLRGPLAHAKRESLLSAPYTNKSEREPLKESWGNLGCPLAHAKQESLLSAPKVCTPGSLVACMNERNVLARAA